MTEIAYIGQIPANEWRDRSAAPAPKVFIPFTQMTKGELDLALEMERIQIYSAFYPEVKSLKAAATTLQNALYKGVNQVRFVGNVDQNLARLIDQAQRQTAPASRYFIGRNTPGIAIGDPIIPPQFANVDCKKITTDKWQKKIKDQIPTAARVALYRLMPQLLLANNTQVLHQLMMTLPLKKYREQYQKDYTDCVYAKDVETILNQNLERASPHMLYHQMPSTFEPAVGTIAAVKRLLHAAGVSDISRLAGVSNTQMEKWVENGILRSAVNAGGQPLPSLVYSAALTPDPDKWTKKVIEDLKVRGGSVNAIDPATITLIKTIGAIIVSALTAAASLQKEFNQKRIVGITNAQGFGTSAFQPEKSDYTLPKSASVLPPPTGSSNTGLLIAAAAGAYLLTQ